MELLIDRQDYPVDVNDVNSKGLTPLHIAAANNQPDVIGVIMKYHAFYDPKMLVFLLKFWGVTNESGHPGIPATGIPQEFSGIMPFLEVLQGYKLSRK